MDRHGALVCIVAGDYGGVFGIDAGGWGEPVEALHMLVFSDGDHLTVRTHPGKTVRFMLKAGTPFNERIAPYGPFVMNTQEEIQQAFDDLRNGWFVTT